MKTFLHYLAEAEASREYHLRIKTVFPLDEHMDAIETLLKKYRLIDANGPHKTIIQANPLDFADIDNAHVYILDIVTGMPVSAYVLQQELITALKQPEKFLIVRGDNDPMEVEAERLRSQAEIEEKAEEEGLDRLALLNTNPEYFDHEKGEDGKKFYGDEYNSTFLKYLSQVAATRRDAEVKPASPLFSFLKDEKPEAEDFNAGIDGVKPEPWWLNDGKAAPDPLVSPEGNYDDDARTYGASFTNQKGKQVDLTATTRSVRNRTPSKGKTK